MFIEIISGRQFVGSRLSPEEGNDDGAPRIRGKSNYRGGRVASRHRDNAKSVNRSLIVAAASSLSPVGGWTPCVRPCREINRPLRNWILYVDRRRRPLLAGRFAPLIIAAVGGACRLSRSIEDTRRCRIRIGDVIARDSVRRVISISFVVPLEMNFIERAYLYGA